VLVDVGGGGAGAAEDLGVAVVADQEAELATLSVREVAWRMSRSPWNLMVAVR
jgi:hypothetical protein